MAKTPSRMLPIGTKLPDFSLPECESGKLMGPKHFAEKELLVVMFICNHCPYVQHLRGGLSRFSKDYAKKSVGIVAINSNDWTKYPDDSPAKMAIEKKEFGYDFPYLADEDQSVAKAFEAACTPEFYLFDKSRKLIYRGQFDASRPGGNQPVTGKDLRDAIEAAIAANMVSADQIPSVGCNIKWKPGNEPAYFK